MKIKWETEDIIVEDSGSQSMISGPTAASFPGNLLEMNTDRAHLRPTES